MNKEERLGIFGGTFDPPHNGHVRALEVFHRELRLDRVLIIPAGIPPHKRISGLDNPGIRIEMARAAFENVERGIEVCDYEVSKSGPSYTVDTVRHFSREEREIFLLCGTDMFLTFDEWKEFETIFSLVTVVCMPRENENRGKIMERSVEYGEKYGARCIVLDGECIELSSTALRTMIQNGEDIGGLVPAGVVDVIDRERLYG